MNPSCHVVDCSNPVTHSHYELTAPYEQQFFCPMHTGLLMEADKSYVCEPWRTELSETQVEKLLAKERSK